MSDVRFRPSRPMNLWQRCLYQGSRLTFTAGYRQPFWETLRFLLDNGRPMKEALRMISDIHTDFGRRWHPLDELIQDCLQSLGENTEGHQLPDVLAHWVPEDEAALIGAGLKSGQVSAALAQAGKMIDARLQILAQVLQAAIYPLALLAIFAAMLALNSLQLVPQLSKLSDPDSWQGALGVLKTLADVTSAWGVWAAVAGVVLIALVFWSLPRWRGRLRRVADMLMPWSLYADLQGAVFMMNVAALLEAGVPEIEILRTLRRFSSPWLRERIDAAIAGVNRGNSLGMALRNSGYHFPDKESVNYLALLGRGDGAGVLIAKYAERSLEKTLARVARRAATARMVSILLIFAFFALMGLVAMDIQAMSWSSMH